MKPTLNIAKNPSLQSSLQPLSEDLIGSIGDVALRIRFDTDQVTFGTLPDVASYIDSVGGVTFSEADAAERPHITEYDTVLNNRTVAEFTAGQGLLSDSCPISQIDFTTVIIGKRPFTGGEHFSLAKSTGGNNYLSFSVDGANKPTAVMYDGGAANEASSHSACDAYGTDTPYIVVASYTRATPSISFKVNDGAEASHTFTLTGDYDDGAIDRICLGRRYMNGAFVVNGINDFAELILFSKLLTNDEKLDVYNYAQHKYGV